MLEWNVLEAHDISLARTPLVQMFISIDTPRLPDQRYQAHVRSLNYALLASVDDLPTMEAARKWCMATYAVLLHAELTTLSTPTAN